VTPFVVVASNAAGEPLFLCPMGRRSLGELQVVEYLGGKHANFNMALWRRDVAANIEADDLQAVLRQLDGKVDLLMLRQQPLTWSGTTNPFALLPHRVPPISAYLARWRQVSTRCCAPAPMRSRARRYARRRRR